MNEDSEGGLSVRVSRSTNLISPRLARYMYDRILETLKLSAARRSTSILYMALRLPLALFEDGWAPRASEFP